MLCPLSCLQAITALYVGYATAGQHGHSGTPGVDDTVQMVVPISGEMKNQAFCKGVSIPSP